MGLGLVIEFIGTVIGFAGVTMMALGILLGWFFEGCLAVVVGFIGFIVGIVVGLIGALIYKSLGGAPFLPDYNTAVAIAICSIVLGVIGFIIAEVIESN